MCYVLPISKQLRGKLLDYNRLYAYPSIPEQAKSGGFVILDSGAFALSQSGGNMDDNYMQRLNTYYKKFARENTYCAAPDVFLNPFETVSNFQFWKLKNYHPVCPVLQSSKRYDIKDILWQIDEYESEFWFFSNPSLTGRQAQGKYRLLKQMCEKIRSMGGKWIHCLGAGWNLQDIKDWWQLGLFDSMDSIAYYTSVQNNEYWTTNNDVFENARLANDICKRNTPVP